MGDHRMEPRHRHVQKTRGQGACRLRIPRASLDGFELKLIAMVFMFFDHVRSYVAYDVLPEWTSLIPRFVAPLFVFFLVEGFYHTHDRRAYALRLYAAAVIMTVGNMAINIVFHNVDPLTGEITLYSMIQGNDIFLTLALFLSIMILVDRVRHSLGGPVARIFAAAGAVVLSGLSLLCEGGLYLLPVLGCFYFLREHRVRACAGVAVWCAMLFAHACLSALSGSTGISLASTLCFDNEWMMVAVTPFVLCYNGKRGCDTRAARSLFYWFYPIHLWVLMAASHLLTQ